MKRRRAVVGLCILFVMALSAFAVQGASAQEFFTCAKNGGKKDFGSGDSHCSKAKVAEGTGEYGHVAWVGEKTSATLSNETTGGAKPTTKLKSVQSGVTLELQSTELSGPASVQNSGGNATGTGVITYKHVTVTAPAGKGCKIKSAAGVAETIVTNSLSFTTAGLTNELKITATAGSEKPFAEFTVEGCSIGALNHTYTFAGSLKGTTAGATTTFTHTASTSQGTFFTQGQAAGIEGTLTFKGENGNGLALT